MTTLDVKEYLRRYRNLKREGRSLRAALLEANELADGLKSPLISDMPKGNHGESDLSSAIARIDSLERKLSRKCGEIQQALEDISETISRIEDEQQRTIIRMRYIEGRSWANIAVLLERSEPWVFKLHGEALDAILQKDSARIVNYSFGSVEI
ncbi:MAG: hypothetical protein MJZ76_06515 [Bacteroidales bacterium]|nr:hypothetical protein [Bacteroidales bacterium]